MNPLQQQQFQQQQRLAAMYSMQQQQARMQQQQQQQQHPQQQQHQPGSFPPNPNSFFANTSPPPDSAWADPASRQSPLNPNAFHHRPPMPQKRAFPQQQHLPQQHPMYGRPMPVQIPGQAMNAGAPGSVNSVALAAAQTAQQQHQQQQQQQQQHQQQQAAAAQEAVNGANGTVYGQPAQLSARPPVVPAATAPSASAPNVEPILAKTETDRKNLQLYQHRDSVYQETLNQQHKRHNLIAQEKKREIEAMQAERRLRLHAGPVAAFGAGYSGCGNAATGVQSRVLYPRDRKRPRQTREFRFGLDDLAEQARQEDNLVPIRLEMEIDGYKLRDTFTWNLNETLITPEQFAEVMCEDLQLPSATFAPQIARGIQEQVHDYYLHASSMVKADDTDKPSRDKLLAILNKKDIKDEEMEETPSARVVEQEEDGGESSEKLCKKRSKSHHELRMLIKLDITVGNRALIDQFEWDINSQKNSPEAFADTLANDLGLGGEFKTAIAHSIREQVHVFVKSLLLVGYDFDGSSIPDDELRQSFLPALKSTWRDLDAIDRFTPVILELTDLEIDKIEKDRMRDARRKRRQARGRRGVVMPDREPQKTHRTAIAVPPDPDVSDEQFLVNAGMVNGVTTRSSTPSSMTYEPMHSQRRSAMKARMNIAADAASNHHMNPAGQNNSPQPGLGMQGVISLNAGNRFSSMMDHTARPMPS